MTNSLFACTGVFKMNLTLRDVLLGTLIYFDVIISKMNSEINTNCKTACLTHSPPEYFFCIEALNFRNTEGRHFDSHYHVSVAQQALRQIREMVDDKKNHHAETTALLRLWANGIATESISTDWQSLRHLKHVAKRLHELNTCMHVFKRVKTNMKRFSNRQRSIDARQKVYDLFVSLFGEPDKEEWPQATSLLDYYVNQDLDWDEATNTLKSTATRNIAFKRGNGFGSFLNQI